MNDSQKSLTLDKFLFCYQPLPTLSTKGTYYIKCREEKYRLVTDDAWIVSQIRSSRKESSWCILILKKGQKKGLCCTGAAPATEPLMPKLERVAQIQRIMLSRCKGYPVRVLIFSPLGLLFIYTSLCACRRPSPYPLGH